LSSGSLEWVPNYPSRCPVALKLSDSQSFSFVLSDSLSWRSHKAHAPRTQNRRAGRGPHTTGAPPHAEAGRWLASSARAPSTGGTGWAALNSRARPASSSHASRPGPRERSGCPPHPETLQVPQTPCPWQHPPSWRNATCQRGKGHSLRSCRLCGCEGCVLVGGPSGHRPLEDRRSAGPGERDGAGPHPRSTRQCRPPEGGAEPKSQVPVWREELAWSVLSMDYQRILEAATERARRRRSACSARFLHRAGPCLPAVRPGRAAGHDHGHPPVDHRLVAT
jgi:hypothetical protein